MAEGNWSVIRVEKISAEGAQKTERHNERKNESYANLNVDTERIARNVHFKDTGGLTYNEYFQRLIDDGKISTRGQKAGSTIFKERLAHIQERIEAEQVRYEPAHEVRKTMAEIEGMGQKTITGKIAVSKDDYQQLTALAKEGITSRSEIQDLKSSVSYYQRQYFNASSAVERLQERYDRLKEKCQPFLQALEHFPKLVEVFAEKVKELFSIKEVQERKEREDRAAARKEQSKHRRGRNDWER